MIFVRASPASESETKPDTALLEEMTTYNTSLVSAGILLSAEGLLPSNRGTRIVFQNDGPPTIQAGPFPSNELVSGFWIVKGKDIEEAVEWAKKAPFKEGAITEVRKIAEMEDFGEAMTEELKEKEEGLRKKVEKAAESG